MRRAALLTLAVLMALLIGGVAFARVAGSPASGPVYTVAQVRVGLAHNPRAWTGRTVLVHGVAMGCISGSRRACRAFDLLDHPPSSLDAPDPQLLLAPGPAIPLWAFLRRVPLLEQFMPALALRRRQQAAIYRVTLSGACTPEVCTEGLLVDSAAVQAGT